MAILEPSRVVLNVDESNAMLICVSFCGIYIVSMCIQPIIAIFGINVQAWLSPILTIYYKTQVKYVEDIFVLQRACHIFDTLDLILYLAYRPVCKMVLAKFLT